MDSRNLPIAALDGRVHGIFIECDNEGGAVIRPVLAGTGRGLPLLLVAPETAAGDTSQDALLAAPRWVALLSAIAAAAGGTIRIETCSGASWTHNASSPTGATAPRAAERPDTVVDDNKTARFSALRRYGLQRSGRGRVSPMENNTSFSFEAKADI